jgi:hypothetical protein
MAKSRTGSQAFPDGETADRIAMSTEAAEWNLYFDESVGRSRA